MKNLYAKLMLILATTSLVACLPQIESEHVAVETAGTGTTDPGFTTTPEDGSTSNPDSGASGGTPTDGGGVASNDGTNSASTGTNTSAGSGSVVGGDTQPPVQTSLAEGILINGGDTYTSESTLVLELYKDESLQMKLSANKNCQGGSWEPYKETVNYSLPQELQNKVVDFSVRFSDFDGHRSICYSASILHDGQGPEILFKKYPEGPVRENLPVELIYSVDDSGSGVAEVSCSLNGFVKSCGAGNVAVHIPGAAPGTYTFEVTATDHVGFTSTKSISWTVTAWGRRVTHDISVAEYRKWDILIVDDNSGSMTYEQQSMASRTRNFLSILRGLDWQIAVTTTDPRPSVYDKSGRLVPCVGCDGAFINYSGWPSGIQGELNYILKHDSMAEANAQAILSQTLQRPEVGSGSEQGIRSVYRVIERSLAGETHHAQFIRSDANLAVVLISDEDESANTAKNDPQKLLDLVRTSYNGQKNFLFNSIVTVPDDSACLKTHGAVYGHRYKALTELTGGIMGSVCESDYAAQMVGIAENIRSQAKSFTLNCVPMAEKGVTVYKDGVTVTDTFTTSGVKLTFDQAIQPGSYQLVYYCLNQ